MLAYEIWTTILVLGVIFAALYPDDFANFLRLLALAPAMLRLWLIQRWYMIKLRPRLALDNFLLMRRVRKLRRRYNTDETTNKKDNE